MHPHAGPLAHRRERQVIPYAQLIDGMTGLMDHRKQGAVHAVRVMGGDTHILVVKVGGKRMGADRHNAPVKNQIPHIPPGTAPAPPAFPPGNPLSGNHPQSSFLPPLPF